MDSIRFFTVLYRCVMVQMELFFRRNTLEMPVWRGIFDPFDPMTGRRRLWQGCARVVEALIIDVRDTAELRLRQHDAPSRRHAAREWGVLYVTRPANTRAAGRAGRR